MSVWKMLFGGKKQPTIHIAAQTGDMKVVKVWLKREPDSVFSKSDDGLTPLHKAAAAGHTGVAELLLVHKANVNARMKGGDSTPLHWAADAGHKDVAELLLAHKADVNAKDHGGTTPLHKAAANGQKDVAELLLAHKADVNAKDDDGWTPLHMAAFRGRGTVVELLLARNAEVNATINTNGDTPLHMAALSRHQFPDVAELLLAHKADVSAEDNAGLTPFDKAASTGSTKVAELLRQHKPRKALTPLVDKLISQDEPEFLDGLREAVGRADSGDHEAVEAMREALRIRSGKSKLSLYRSGIVMATGPGLGMGRYAEARAKILELAERHAFLEDPEHSGDLISALTVSISDANEMLVLLRDIYAVGNKSDGHIFQLLFNELRCSAKLGV